MQRILVILFAILVAILAVRACTSISKPTKPLDIARDQNWGTLDLKGREKDVLAFSDELVREVMLFEGFQVRMHSLNTQGLFPGLDLGVYDAVLGITEPTPKLRQSYAFSEPYFKTGLVLLVRQNSDIDSLDDLPGRSIGAHISSNITFDTEKYPGIRLQVFQDADDGVSDLLNGRYEAILVGNLYAKLLTSGVHFGKLKIVSDVLTGEGLYFVTIKGDPAALIEKFEEGLIEFKESGRYDALIKKWQVPQ